MLVLTVKASEEVIIETPLGKITVSHRFHKPSGHNKLYIDTPNKETFKISRAKKITPLEETQHDGQQKKESTSEIPLEDQASEF